MELPEWPKIVLSRLVVLPCPHGSKDWFQCQPAGHTPLQCLRALMPVGDGASEAPKSSQPLGLRKGWGCIVQPTFPLNRVLCSPCPSGTPHYWEVFLSACCAFEGGAGNVQPECSAHLLSRPTNHRDTMQRGLMFLDISRASCTEVLGFYSFQVPLPPTCGLGGWRDWDPLDCSFATLPFSVGSSLSRGQLCSLQVDFRCCICCIFMFHVFFLVKFLPYLSTMPSFQAFDLGFYRTFWNGLACDMVYMVINIWLKIFL